MVTIACWLTRGGDALSATGVVFVATGGSGVHPDVDGLQLKGQQEGARLPISLAFLWSLPRAKFLMVKRRVAVKSSDGELLAGCVACWEEGVPRSIGSIWSFVADVVASFGPKCA